MDMCGHAPFTLDKYKALFAENIVQLKSMDRHCDIELSDLQSNAEPRLKATLHADVLAALPTPEYRATSSQVPRERRCWVFTICTDS